jgi:hypothetical protein
MHGHASRRAVTLVGCLVGLTGLILPPSAAAAEPAGAQAALTAVSGTGSGLVLIAPTAEDQGTFAVQITVNVRDASPNMAYTVSRAADLNPDGVCTLASGWLVNGGASWRPLRVWRPVRRGVPGPRQRRVGAPERVRDGDREIAENRGRPECAARSSVRGELVAAECPRVTPG